MKKSASFFLLLLVLLSATKPAFSEEKARYLYTSTYVLENRGDEELTLESEEATVPLFMSDSWQSVKVLSVSVPIASEYTDEDGNRLAGLNLSRIPPRSRLNFSVTYEVELLEKPRPSIEPSKSGTPSDIPEGLVEVFSAESESFIIRNREIIDLAERLTRNESTVLGKLNRLVNWFIANVSYINFEVPRYPNETLAGKKGDCDDQAILLITMCRALGIPAILQIGVLFDDDIVGEKTSWGGHLKSEQKGIGWHGWALVYVPPWGWLPVDLTLASSRDPLQRLLEAPEYGNNIAVCFNVSRQDYIGESRTSREQIMSSSLYIYSIDTATRLTQTVHESPLTYVLLGTSGGFVIIVFVVLITRRRLRTTGPRII